MIILASQSPRRKQLMQEEISSCFTIIVPEIDESLSFKNFSNVVDIVKDISKRKCLEIVKLSKCLLNALPFIAHPEK
jgi:predicted house-cleaning NTP pyrophosphatase (Maf/HAM1 superfamily)